MFVMKTVFVRKVNRAGNGLVQESVRRWLR